MLGPSEWGLRVVDSRRRPRDVWKASLENGDDGVVMGERRRQEEEACGIEVMRLRLFENLIDLFLALLGLCRCTRFL